MNLISTQAQANDAVSDFEKREDYYQKLPTVELLRFVDERRLEVSPYCGRSELIATLTWYDIYTEEDD